jgi:GntR family transcriptional regulator, transcriptional repressor for pyruvate dehydrogenase complex
MEQNIERNSLLVDRVEGELLAYFREREFRPGDSLPGELELVSQLGVGRSVVREVLSRLRMLGLIESRPRRGMTLAEPNLLGGIQRVLGPHYFSEATLLDLLEFRISLEVGISGAVVRRVSATQLEELDRIVSQASVGPDNRYGAGAEFAFHAQLYAISGNLLIRDFQEMIHPLMSYLKDRFESEIAPLNQVLAESGRLVTHAELLRLLREGQEAPFRQGLEEHFSVYREFLERRREVLRGGFVQQGESASCEE